MLHQVLKQATTPYHQDLEQLMFVNQIMNGELTLQQYKHLLITNYLVHEACEYSLFNNLSDHIASKLQLSHRNKSAALLADINELSLPIPQLATSEIPAIEKTDGAILGAMYVLEGATLGGNVIVKRLKLNEQLKASHLNFNYYQVYGENLIPYWKTFCTVLDEQPAESFDSAVNAAKTMFNYIAVIQKQHGHLF